MYLSSFSFKVLASLVSGKRSWPATTVLLLDVVPRNRQYSKIERNVLI